MTGTTYGRVAGPIFGSDPDVIQRSNGQQVQIPDAYFCVTVGPYQYSWDRQSNDDVACFTLPQDAPSGSSLSQFAKTLQEIAQDTNLSFLVGWDHDIGDTLRVAERDICGRGVIACCGRWLTDISDCP